MRQYTDPTYTLLVKKMTIAPTDRIFISFADSQRRKLLTITECTVRTGEEDGTYLDFELTQAQTGMFNYHNSVSVQVNWIDSFGKRHATEIKEVPSLENLIKEVL